MTFWRNDGKPEVANESSGDGGWNLITIVLAFCLFQSCNDSSSNKSEIRDLKREVTTLESENDSLEIRIEKIETVSKRGTE